MSESENVSTVDSTTDRLARWVLLRGDRLLLSAVLTVGIFVVFLAFGLAGLVTTSNPNRAMWFLNGTINGLLTLVPIAVGVNQIVLSQELGSLDQLYERTQGTLDSRERIADAAGVDVSSPKIGDFFRDMIAAIDDRATELRDVGADVTDEELKAYVDDYTGTLIEQLDDVSVSLDEVDFRLLDALVIMLDYHNSWQLHTARKLQASYGDALPEPAMAKLEAIEELFTQLDATRDYLKTLWIQRELAELSRMMLYTGIPAVLVAGLAIFVYRDVPGVTVPRPVVVILLSATVAISILPLSVLVAYVVRISIVVQRTAAFGPFIPEEEQRRISDRVTMDT